MNVYYLDASAWVKRYAQEQGSSWVDAWFALEMPGATSIFGVIEVRRALARNLRDRNIAQSDYVRATTQVIEDRRRLVELPLSEDVMMSSLDLIDTYALRSGDIVHLASAEVLRKQRPQDDVVFISSDRELATAAAHAGFEIVVPELQP